MQTPIEIWDPADYAVYAFQRTAWTDDDAPREDIEQALRDLDRMYRACQALGVESYMEGQSGPFASGPFTIEGDYQHHRSRLEKALETARPKDEPPPPPQELGYRAILNETEDREREPTVIVTSSARGSASAIAFLESSKYD